MSPANHSLANLLAIGVTLNGCSAGASGSDRQQNEKIRSDSNG
jgi:hypothetical protein